MQQAVHEESNEFQPPATHFVWLLPHRRTGVLLLMLFYMDDSGHEDNTDVFAAGGLVAPWEAWAAFEQEWTSIIGGRVFKMAHLHGKTGHGDFHGWSLADRMKLVNTLAELINKHLHGGIAVCRSLTVSDYQQKLIPASPMFLENTAATWIGAIGWVLRMCLEYLVGDSSCVQDLLKNGRTIKVVFESGTKWLTDALLMCNTLINTMPWGAVFTGLVTEPKTGPHRVVSLHVGEFFAYHKFQAAVSRREGRQYAPVSFTIATAGGLRTSFRHLDDEKVDDMIKWYEFLYSLRLGGAGPL